MSGALRLREVKAYPAVGVAAGSVWLAWDVEARYLRMSPEQALALAHRLEVEATKAQVIARLNAGEEGGSDAA